MFRIFPKLFHQGLSNLDTWCPWTCRWTYQCLVMLTQLSRSQPDVTCENIDAGVHKISISFLWMAFRFEDMIYNDHGQNLRSIFGDYGSIFKVTAGLNAWKYCIFTHCVQNISKLFLWMAFKIGHMVTVDIILDVSTLGDRGSIFNVTVGLNVWTNIAFYTCVHDISQSIGWMVFSY